MMYQSVKLSSLLLMLVMKKKKMNVTEYDITHDNYVYYTARKIREPAFGIMKPSCHGHHMLLT